MNELSSTEFRKTFARLSKPTVVTVNGHPIGRWVPGAPLSEVFLPEPMGTDFTLIEDRTIARKPSTQAQRDDLLRKINRGK